VHPATTISSSVLSTTALSPAWQSGLHIRPIPLCLLDTSRTTARADERWAGGFSAERHSRVAASFDGTARAPWLEQFGGPQSQLGERHAVNAQDDGSGRVCGSAVWLSRRARPHVCDAGASGTRRSVAAVMLPAFQGDGGRRREIEDLFRWRVGERCGANWAWMSMRRRLITRVLTKRVVPRRRVPRRTGPPCSPAWHAGCAGRVAGRAWRCRAVAVLRGGWGALPLVLEQKGRA